MLNINLHIDRLILDGIDIASHQHTDLQMVVETEIARLLSEGGLGSGLSAGTTVRELSGGMIQPAGSDPTEFGKQIARAVYGGIGE